LRALHAGDLGSGAERGCDLDAERAEPSGGAVHGPDRSRGRASSVRGLGSLSNAGEMLASLTRWFDVRPGDGLGDGNAGDD